MKRILSIILTLSLLLPGIALADVQSQINSPTNYNAVWQSTTGKTDQIQNRKDRDYY